MKFEPVVTSAAVVQGDLCSVCGVFYSELHFGGFLFPPVPKVRKKDI